MPEDLVVNIVLDTSEYLAGLDEVASSTRDTVGQISDLWDSISTPVLNLEEWNASVDDMVGSVDEAAQQITSDFEAIADPVVNTEGVVGAAQEMADSVTAATTQMEESMGGVDASVAETAAQMQIAFAGAGDAIASSLQGKISDALDQVNSKVSSAIGDIQKTLGGLGIGLTVGAGVPIVGSLYEGMTRQTQAYHVQGNTQIPDSLRNFVDQLGQQLSVATPQNYSDILTSAQNAIGMNAMFQNQKTLQDTLTQSAMIASNTGASMPDTTNLLAQMMVNFGMNPQDAGNQMTSIMAQGHMNMQQMSTAFGQPAQVASQMGLGTSGVSDLGAAFDVLTSSGNTSNEASTKITDILQGMTSASQQQLNALSDISAVTHVDLYKDFTDKATRDQKGILGIMEDLNTATSGANLQKLRNSVGGGFTPSMNTLFAMMSISPQQADAQLLGGGQRGVIGAQDIIQHMSRARTIQGNIQNAQSNDTTLQEFKNLNSTPAAKMTEAIHNLENALQELGSQPAILSIVNGLTSFVNSISNFVEKNPKAVSEILKLAGTTGLVALGFSKAIGIVEGFIKTGKKISTIAEASGLSGLGSLILGIAAIVTLFALAWIQNWDNVRGSIDKLVKQAETVLMPMFKDIKKTVKDNHATFQAIVAFLEGAVVVAFKLVVGAILLVVEIVVGLTDAIVHIIAWIGDFVSWLNKLYTSAQGVAKALEDNIGKFFKNFPNTLGTAINIIKSQITGLLNLAKRWGMDLLSNLASGIWAGVKWVQDAVKFVASSITKFLHFSKPDEGPLAQADKWMPDMMQLLSNGIIQGAPRLKQALTSALNGAGAFGTSLLAGSVPLTSAGGAVANSNVYNQTNHISMSGISNNWQAQQSMKNALESTALNKLNYF